MGLLGLSTETQAEEYQRDPRPEPTKVEIESSDWDEVVNAVRNCEQQFGGERVKQWFFYGENDAYKKELKILRTDVIPTLKKNIKGRSVKVRFKCNPRSMGSAGLSVDIIGILRLEVFSQFYDSFTPRICSGSAEEYVSRNIFSVLEKVRGFELL